MPDVAARLVEAVQASVAGVHGTIFLAVSGGMDSMALLRAARTGIAAERLHVLHADHGLQLESAGWATTVATAAEGLQYSSERFELDGPGNLEAQARSARYGWFSGLLKPEDVLLTAHHRKDQAETVLMRLLQGRGAYGMPRVRVLGAGSLMRPFLATPWEDLQSAAQHWQLEWVEDPSNRDTTLLRNKVRHELLPVLVQQSEGAEALLCNLGAAAQQIELQGRSLYGGFDPLPIQALPEHPQRLAVALRWWLAGFGAEAGHRTLASWSLSGTRQIPGGALVAHAGALYFAKTLAPSYEVPPSGVLDLPHGVLGGVPAGAHVEFGTAAQCMRVGGRERRVSELLRVAGIPAWQRDRVPLVLAEGTVLAVGDLHVHPELQLTWQPKDASGNFSRAA